MSLENVFVYHALRTPRGAAKESGSLHAWRPVSLLKALLHELGERGLQPDAVDDFLLGCSTQVGDQGANLAQTALRYAGFDQRVPGGTLNRFCCSGLDALRYAAAQVESGMASAVLAGGVESMSRVPMFADRGAWFADPEVATKTGFVHMGVAADVVATRHGIQREACDAFALRSHRRAAQAEAEGRFVSRVILRAEAADAFAHDECIRPQLSAQKLAALPSAFEQLGRDSGGHALACARYGLAQIDPVHTVGTSPAMCDAASLLVVGGGRLAARLGRPPRARLRGISSLSSDPVCMLEGPAEAVRRACHHAGCTPEDLDLLECNESFAATALHTQRLLQTADDAFNPNGGAIAMGHPLGATGGVLVSTLLDELERRDARLGAVVIPAGGGIAMAAVFERS